MSRAVETEEADKMNHSISVKVDAAQLSHLQYASKKCGMTVSAFIRHQALKIAENMCNHKDEASDLFDRLWEPEDAAHMRLIVKELKKFIKDGE